MYLNVHHKWFSFHRILIYASESFERTIYILYLHAFNIRYARMPSVFAESRHTRLFNQQRPNY